VALVTYRDGASPQAANSPSIKGPDMIIQICTRFETTWSTRLAGGWLLIFMMYSTLLPRGKGASLDCSEHGCQLPLRLRGSTPPVNHEVAGYLFFSPFKAPSTVKYVPYSLCPNKKWATKQIATIQ